MPKFKRLLFISPHSKLAIIKFKIITFFNFVFTGINKTEFVISPSSK